MLGTALTSIIGLVAKGKAAKAMAGGLAGTILTAGEPIINAFGEGFSSGAIPQVTELGTIVGQALVGYLVGFAVTWFAPKNKTT